MKCKSEDSPSMVYLTLGLTRADIMKKDSIVLRVQVRNEDSNYPERIW